MIMYAYNREIALIVRMHATVLCDFSNIDPSTSVKGTYIPGRDLLFATHFDS